MEILLVNLRGEVLKCMRKNINFLRYNNHICYVDDINTFFKRFRCPSCDTFIQKMGNFNRHVKTCKDRVQHIYLKSVYTLRPYLINLTDLEFLTTMIKNCSKTWLFLTLNRYVYPRAIKRYKHNYLDWKA